MSAPHLSDDTYNVDETKQLISKAIQDISTTAYNPMIVSYIHAVTILLSQITTYPGYTGRDYAPYAGKAHQFHSRMNNGGNNYPSDAECELHHIEYRHIFSEFLENYDQIIKESNNSQANPPE